MGLVVEDDGTDWWAHLSRDALIAMLEEQQGAMQKMADRTGAEVLTLKQRAARFRARNTGAQGKTKERASALRELQASTRITAPQELANAALLRPEIARLWAKPEVQILGFIYRQTQHIAKK